MFSLANIEKEEADEIFNFCNTGRNTSCSSKVFNFVVNYKVGDNCFLDCEVVESQNKNNLKRINPCVFLRGHVS